MNKSYEIGFKHGMSGDGTNGFKPGNRKFGGSSLHMYSAGFQAGMIEYHKAKADERASIAILNNKK